MTNYFKRLYRSFKHYCIMKIMKDMLKDVESVHIDNWIRGQAPEFSEEDVVRFRKMLRGDRL